MLSDIYENVVTAIETVSLERDINLDFVKSCLLDAEIEQEENGVMPSSISKEEVAFSTPKQVECFKCHKKGHIAANCRSRSNYCGRGYRRGGFNRNKDYQSNLTQQDENVSFVAMSEEELICTNADTRENTINFILDLGATDFLVKEHFEKCMHKVEKLENPIKIKVANGEHLEARKKGTITIYYKEKQINIEALTVQGLYQNIISVKKLIKRVVQE